MRSDVIVVGAGAAGLAAARYLATRSLRVVVLEARDRVGGRAWSRRFGRNAVPVELGAEFIHGRAELTHALLLEAGLAAVDTCGESWSGRNGTFRRDDGEFMSAVRIFARTQELRDDESVDRFLARFAGNPAMHETVKSARAFVEGFDAADPAIASAQSIFEEFSAGLDTASARPMGGYQALFDYLRDACIAQGVEVHLSAIVRRITWENGGVVVDAAMADGEERRFEAGCAIITLPVGVLRHGARDGTDVAFEPALPPNKHHALHAIEMGHVIRLALRFRTRFWEKVEDGRYRDGGFFRGMEGPFGVVWTQVPIRSEHLVAWCGGPKADALKDASEDDLITLTLDKVGSLFGDPDLVRAQFEAATMHDWAGDPFARGAYSYLRTGGMGARAALAAPIDETLFFAGEATSTNGESGTVNGALETGERAAREIVAALK